MRMTQRDLGYLGMLLLSVSAASCAPAPGSGDDCEALTAAMARCFPDLEGTAACTDELLVHYGGMDLDGMECDVLADAGKADFWSRDYTLNWPDGGSGDPLEEDWDIVALIDGFQDQSRIPEPELDEILGREEAELVVAASSTAWEQIVDDGLGDGPQEMVVEHTEGIVPVGFELFLSLFPPELWGPSLDHYLGGEIKIYERDDEGRVTRQVERMVLNQVPFDGDLLNLPLLNGDMTKVEVIVREHDRVTVYWRVTYSANGTTESDVGSVTFERYPSGTHEHTLVTFHSAHRLATFGLHVPNALLMVPGVGLGAFFEEHIDHYRELVMDVACSDGRDSDYDGYVDCDDEDCHCF